MLKRKIEISKELDSLKDPTMMRSTMSNLNNSIKIHQLEEELHQLQDAIELSVLDQVHGPLQAQWLTCEIGSVL